MRNSSLQYNKNNYYPFGLEHAGYNKDVKEVDFADYLELTNEELQNISEDELLSVVPVIKNKYKYKYQGQERQDELNLNWDSFKWRNYDYAIGRFMSVDPLAEKYAYQSPYNFSENRVVDAVELEGLEAVFWEFTFDSDGYRSGINEVRRIEKSYVEKISETLGWQANDGGNYYIKGEDGNWRTIPSDFNGSVLNASNETINSWGDANYSYKVAGGLLAGEVIGEYVVPLLETGLAIRATRNSKRPSWRDSEVDALNNSNYSNQVSFKDGVEVPYGTKGSSRPEGYKLGASIEVKNYTLSSRQGQNSLINNVSKQINERMINLPQGTMQNIIIDIRGQRVSGEVQRSISDRIKSKVNTDNYQILFKYK